MFFKRYDELPRNVSGPLLVVSCINIFIGLGGISDYPHPFLLSIRNNCILQLWQRTTNNNQRTLPTAGTQEKT